MPVVNAVLRGLGHDKSVVAASDIVRGTTARQQRDLGKFSWYAVVPVGRLTLCVGSQLTMRSCAVGPVYAQPERDTASVHLYPRSEWPRGVIAPDGAALGVEWPRGVVRWYDAAGGPVAPAEPVTGLAAWEAAVGERAGAWKGRCHEIAGLGVARGLARGRAVYGHWRGDVAPSSMFASRRSDLNFQRHGWIRTDGGEIVDPTRWVFEDVAPYVFRGRADQCPEYDEGGNAVRAMLRRPVPAVSADASDAFLGAPVAVTMGANDVAFLRALLGDGGGFTKARLLWLANHSPEELGEACAPFYRELDRLKMKAIVPIDNWRRVLETQGE